MDNNNKQDPNMKSNWQTITMLVVAAILTFIVVSSMNNYLNSKKRQELSYNEFVQMVEAGEVDSIKVGSTEITVIPKKGNTKYSQNLDYYVVRLEGDYDFVNRILDNNVVTNREKSDSSTLLLVLLNYAVPFLFLLFLMNFTMKRMGGGGIMGVVPGVMGVAAFAPPLDEAGNSVKAQKALAYVAGHLNLNIFGTTRCVMAEKEPAEA